MYKSIITITILVLSIVYPAVLLGMSFDEVNIVLSLVSEILALRIYLDKKHRGI